MIVDAVTYWTVFGVLLAIIIYHTLALIISVHRINEVKNKIKFLKQQYGNKWFDNFHPIFEYEFFIAYRIYKKEQKKNGIKN